MNVVCIKNKCYFNLTLGKLYDIIVLDIFDNYLLIDDKGFSSWYPKKYFKPLSEIRNEKIDKLLDNEN